MRKVYKETSAIRKMRLEQEMQRIHRSKCWDGKKTNKQLRQLWTNKSKTE